MHPYLISSLANQVANPLLKSWNSSYLVTIFLSHYALEHAMLNKHVRCAWGMNPKENLALWENAFRQAKNQAQALGTPSKKGPQECLDTNVPAPGACCCVKRV